MAPEQPPHVEQATQAPGEYRVTPPNGQRFPAAEDAAKRLLDACGGNLDMALAVLQAVAGV